MQTTQTSTQGEGVKVSAKAKREGFYFERLGDGFREWREKSHAFQQRNPFWGQQLRRFRQTLKARQAPQTIVQKFRSVNEGKLISVELECLFGDRSKMPKQRDLGQFLVTMCDDGSIRTQSDSQGTAEVKVTISQNNPMRIKKVTDTIGNFDGSVNQSCGMHIHLDQRGVSYFTASKRAKRLIKCLPVLMKLVAPSRLENQYCQRNQQIRGDGTQYRHSSNRYRMINFLPAYERHKTLEVRLHGGTLDFFKILGWINLCQFLMDCTEVDKIAEQNFRNNDCEVTHPFLEVSISDVIRMEKLPENLRSYIWKRYRQFHSFEASQLREKLMQEGKFHLTDGMAIS